MNIYQNNYIKIIENFRDQRVSVVFSIQDDYLEEQMQKYGFSYHPYGWTYRMCPQVWSILNSILDYMVDELELRNTLQVPTETNDELWYRRSMLEKANKAYYQKCDPIMTDATYDFLWNKCSTLEKIYKTGE